MYYYREGKTQLKLSDDILLYAKAEQEAHFDRSENQGLIEAFLERPVPQDWDTYTLDRRLLYIADTTTEHANLVPRKTVCAMEIWCECLGGKKENFQKSKSYEINNILRRIPGWHQQNSPRTHSIYGNQRGFERDDK